MTLAIKRTGDEDYPRYLKILLNGDPKSGKTTFLSTAPNIIVADVDAGLMSIAHKNVPYVTIDSSNTLMQLLVALRDETLRAKIAQQMGMPKIETVAIDTMDALQQMMKKERMRSERRTSFQQADWGWLLDQFRELMTAFNSLPLHVVYTVHTKTVQDDEQRQIRVPGLQGGIQDEIAGLVGFSLLAKRTKQVGGDGLSYVKYSLVVEGDEKHPHLGNRAAGRLPNEIEPEFNVLFNAVYENLQLAQQQQVQVIASVAEQTAAEGAPQSEQGDGQPSESASTSETQKVDPNPDQPSGTPPADEDGPVNDKALQYLKGMYEVLGLTLPERAQTWTLSFAKAAARQWVAYQQDATTDESLDAKVEMAKYLKAMDMLETAADGTMQTLATPTAPEVIEPKLDGTIKEVIAYVGDDLARAQEAYDLEVAKGDKARSTLTDALLAKGAKPAEAAVEAAATPQPPPQEEQTPVQAPGGVETAPQPDQPPADTASEVSAPSHDEAHDEAVETLKTELGATVVEEATADGTPVCEVCNKPVDDLDIAQLSKARFRKTLCVDDYVAATKTA